MKIRFIAIKNGSGNRSTFIENIQVPKEFENDRMDFLDSFDKSDIIDKRDLYCIIDFFPYIKPIKIEKKPTWKDLALKWEECSNLHETNAKKWKAIALDYKAMLIGTNKINTEPIRDSSLESGRPVDIKLKWDAGWLSPEGIFYGANGDMNLMLHNQLADKLQEIGLIPTSENFGSNCDSWLLNNGWTKIHGNWILYEGYLIAKRSKIQDDFNMPIIKAVPMTEEQREIISIYGKLCHEGILKFGMKQERISVARFEMMESPMIWKLFDY